MELNTTINFTEEDVKKIIKEWLENKNYQVTGEVKIDIGKVSVGYGPTEHDAWAFRGASCQVKLEA